MSNFKTFKKSKSQQNYFFLNRQRIFKHIFADFQFQFVNTLCVEKELKVRIKELVKYRDHGLTKQGQLVPFEQLRFRREIRLKRIAKLKAGGGGSGSCTPVPPVPARFLPQPGDYSLKVLIYFSFSLNSL